ncbi:hypothetical protein BJ508DRAFT_21572 [Ascobolus immersus RN42]|uniref:Transmembrane protein n=1 Tax=Ascobolus immersus RN42 TaxID=1160509 RepID=A0A3N4HQ36_ASCIM|nr:hypothetical protein BJ508DRAFT_21572 [Ascobolus immersus RN42]
MLVDWCWCQLIRSASSVVFFMVGGSFCPSPFPFFALIFPVRCSSVLSLLGLSTRSPTFSPSVVYSSLCVSLACFLPFFVCWYFYCPVVFR